MKQYTCLITCNFLAESDEQAIEQALAFSVVDKDAGIIQSDAYFLQRDAVETEDGEEIDAEIIFE